MKYYFITYQATNRGGSVSTWNQVIKGSPMAFIKHVESVEEKVVEHTITLLLSIRVRFQKRSLVNLMAIFKNNEYE
jgi:hypothetical protein